MSVGEDPRPGRLSTSTNGDHVERVRAVIRGNHCLTVQEVADEVGVSIGSCLQTFTEKLQMRQVSAEIVPRLLTDNQKENRVEISQKLLANANGNENFLNPLAYTDVSETAGLARSINTQPAVRRNSETNPTSQHNRGMY